VDQQYHGGAMKNLLLLSLCVGAWPASASAQAIQALGVFEQRCGSCHTKPAADSRAPDRDSLRQRTPESVYDALTTGSMKVNAEGLTDAQKRMIAEFITERPLGAALAGIQVTVAAGDLAAREARGLARSVGENPVAPAHLLGHPRVRERRILRGVQRDLPRRDHRGLGGDERAGWRLGA